MVYFAKITVLWYMRIMGIPIKCPTSERWMEVVHLDAQRKEFDLVFVDWPLYMRFAYKTVMIINKCQLWICLTITADIVVNIVTLA